MTPTDKVMNRYLSPDFTLFHLCIPQQRLRISEGTFPRCEILPVDGYKDHCGNTRSTTTHCSPKRLCPSGNMVSKAAWLWMHHSYRGSHGCKLWKQQRENGPCVKGCTLRGLCDKKNLVDSRCLFCLFDCFVFWFVLFLLSPWFHLDIQVQRKCEESEGGNSDTLIYILIPSLQLPPKLCT